MDGQHPPHKEPYIRLLAACPHSGSALLTSIPAESSECAVTSRLVPVGSGQRSGDSVRLDLSILESPCRHGGFNQAKEKDPRKQFLICEQQVEGNERERLLNAYLTPSLYPATRPVFLIRDPVRVFDSWKHAGWTDARNLVDCFANVFRVLDRAPPQAISCLLYERLVQQPRKEVERICAWWGVPFSETMLDLKKPLEASPISSTDREEARHCEDKPLGQCMIVVPDTPPHGLVSNDEKDNLEEKLGRLYLRCWQDQVQKLRSVLSRKTWIGFDLDDTLHEFRQASSTATNEVLARMAREYSIPLPALKQEYSKVLQTTTANAFSDGKTSFDYRRERFALVLERFSLPCDARFMTQLLESYEATLSASLELKCGALGLLSAVKDMGKKVVVITEGPQDAQERTVEALGIGGYVDFLATTNRFGVSKTAGLFTEVLRHLGIAAGDMAYVGDSVQRDMEPASGAGIFSIHLAESRNVSLDSVPPRINTLRKLQYILSG